MENLQIDPRIQHRRVQLKDVTLHVAECGEGPLVVLLHGFPEFWLAWRHQIPALADAGFRVVAPDMRGFNESDKPSSIHDYVIENVTDDIAQLVEALGETRATVVGHDWGGAIAWHFAMRHHAITDSLIVMNGPHPVAMKKELRTLRQLRKSWYFFFFQLPWFPERSMSRRNHEALRKVLRADPAREDAFSPAEIQAYVDAQAQPGALTATINYYRAMRYRIFGNLKDLRPVECPVQVIWGEADAYLSIKTGVPSDAWAPKLEVVRVPDASHWIQADAPEAVNEAMLAFLTRHRVEN